MGKLSLFYSIASPAARFAVVTANTLGLSKYIDLKAVNLKDGEQFTPEYLKLNPAGTVPLLIDDDIHVSDSSAISIYLIEKYGKDDSLYPKDPVKRAKVNEKLFYVSSTVFQSGTQIIFPVIFGKATETNPEVLKKFERIFGTIEMYLTKNKYLTGDSMTLPDLFLWSILESATRIQPLNSENSRKLIEWLERMRQHPSNEFMQNGADIHITFYNMCMERNKTLAKI